MTFFSDNKDGLTVLSGLKPNQPAEPSRPVGIIPAYAGNTDPNMVKNGELRDHPRVCGEHGVVSSHSMHSRGSSPRMRGTLPSAWRATVCRGIIPAYAGNTCRFFY